MKDQESFKPYIPAEKITAEMKRWLKANGC